MSLEPLDPFNESSFFEFGQVTLNLPRAYAHPPRDRFFGRMRLFVGLPPMPDQLHEDVELSMADIQPPLRLKQEVRQHRVAVLHHRSAVFVFSAPPVLLGEGQRDDFSSVSVLRRRVFHDQKYAPWLSLRQDWNGASGETNLSGLLSYGAF